MQRSSATRPGRSSVALLAAISTMAILLRYPSGHEAGVDSFDIHAMAGIIASTQHIGWLLNPLSYFGLSPFSYSPAVPTVVATFSSLSGLNLEASIMVYALFLGALVPWTTYAFAFAALHRERAALFTAILVSASSGIVGFTDWTLSTRGTFMVIMPLALAFFLKLLLGQSRTEGIPRAALPLVLVCSVLLFVHALWILFFPLLVGAWTLQRVAFAEDSLLVHSRGAESRTRYVALSLILSAGVLLGLMLYGPTGGRILSNFPDIRLGFLPDTTITRVALQVVTVVGLGVLLLPIGLWRLRVIADRRRLFALTALVFIFVPTALDPVYGILLAIPVMLLLSGWSIFAGSRAGTGGHERLKPWQLVTVTLVAGAVVLVPSLVTIPRSTGLSCGQPSVLDGQTYSLATYLKYATDGNVSFAWDDRIEAGRVEAISGVPAIEPVQSIGTVSIPWLAAKTPVNVVFSGNLFEALATDHELLIAREWLPAAGPAYPYYWGKHTAVLLQSDPNSQAANQILSFYDAKYAVQRCEESPTRFYNGLGSLNYVIFAEASQRVYWVGP